MPTPDPDPAASASASAGEQSLSGGAAALHAAELLGLDDDALLEALQRQTFGFFWEGAHGPSGLARDRHPFNAARADLIAIGGSGFGLMALIVAAERGWVSRDAARQRLQCAVELLGRARTHHGALPHFVDGRSGETIPFMPRDDGGDLVETAFLCMGLLCCRQYFDGAHATERSLREQITQLCERVEWDWYTRGGKQVLYWHWSPTCGWELEHRIRDRDPVPIKYLSSNRDHPGDFQTGCGNSLHHAIKADAEIGTDCLRAGRDQSKVVAHRFPSSNGVALFPRRTMSQE